MENYASVKLVTPRQTSVVEAAKLMRAKGARRVPVVDDQGVLVGIVSVDDFVELLADELGQLAKLVAREQELEVELRR